MAWCEIWKIKVDGRLPGVFLSCRRRPPGGGTSVYMLCISDRDSQGDGSKVQLRGGPAAAFGATLKTFYKVH